MFSVCLDESTYVTSTARLAIIARFPFVDIVKEELIKLMTLSAKTRGESMHELKEEFIELDTNVGNIKL